MMQEKSKYTRLPAEEDESTPLSSGSDEELALRGGQYSKFSKLGSRLFVVACVLSLLCSVVNIAFLIVNAKFQQQLAASGLFVPAVTVDLDRPSVYVGLDKLPPDVAHAALPPTLDVFPPLFKPVDHIHKDFVFPDDEHARFTFNGRIAPGDHRVLLTDHVSMIAQYRVHDFGMERCRITAAIPSVPILQEKNQTLHLAGDTTLIEVWNLTAPAEIDVRKLSWSTKPSRDRLLGRLSVAPNATLHSESFWCGPSGSLQSFELVCKGKSCYIEFFQDFYFKPRFGIFVQQEPSL